jgi:hypothetical protein
MTIIRLENSELIIHSPCRIDESTKFEIDGIGQVKYIVVPGTFHVCTARTFTKQLAAHAKNVPELPLLQMKAYDVDDLETEARGK